MKNFKLKKLIGLALIGGASALSASTVFAAAGETISNTATLGYTVSGVPQTDVPSNTVDFVEDRKINFVVAEVGGATTSVVPGGLAQVQTFTVTNLGNDTQDFLLTALNRANGTVDPNGGANDIFDATNVNVFVEDGTTPGTYEVGEDVGLYINDLSSVGPGNVVTVYVVSDIPGTVTNTQVAVMSLVAQVAESASGGDEGLAASAIINDDNNHFSPAGTYSNGAQAVISGLATIATIADNAATVQTVFADAAGDIDSAGTVAGTASNGQHADSDSYTVAAAVLTVNKAVVAFWDPINGNTNPKSIPGAYVQYTITISNAGPATATLTTLSDILQGANGALALDPNLILATATTPVPTANVDAESGADGNAIRIDTTAAGVGAGTARPGAGVTYCTGDDAVDTDADGCSYTGGAGGTLSINLSHATDPSVTGMAADAPYLEGGLLPGESIDIVFNAIVQ